MLRSPRHRTYNPASRNPRSKSPYKPKPIRRTNRKRSPFRRAWHASAIGRFAHSGTVRRFRRRPRRAGTACPQGFLPGAKILPRRFPERQRSSLPTRQHRTATAYSSRPLRRLRNEAYHRAVLHPLPGLSNRRSQTRLPPEQIPAENCVTGKLQESVS